MRHPSGSVICRTAVGHKKSLVSDVFRAGCQLVAPLRHGMIQIGEAAVEKLIWAIIPMLILVAGLHLVRAGRTERYATGAIALAFGIAFGPQCLCKDLSDALIGALVAATLLSIVVLPVLLLLRAWALAGATKGNNGQCVCQEPCLADDRSGLAPLGQHAAKSCPS